MVRTLGGIAAAVVALSAGTASAGVIAEYALNDHPDGGASLPSYGLRMDGMLGTVTTFSFDVFNDVRLVVSEDNGVLSIDITGTVWGGEDGGSDWVNPSAYAIDFTYTVGVNAVGNGYTVTGIDNTGNVGTMTPLDQFLEPVPNAESELVTITDSNNNSFLFLSDGHRLPGDNSTFVGRGWLEAESLESTPSGGFRDWLFTATLVPTPGAASLLGFAALVGVRRRR